MGWNTQRNWIIPWKYMEAIHSSERTSFRRYYFDRRLGQGFCLVLERNIAGTVQRRIVDLLSNSYKHRRKLYCRPRYRFDRNRLGRNRLGSCKL